MSALVDQYPSADPEVLVDMMFAPEDETGRSGSVKCVRESVATKWSGVWPAGGPDA